MDKSNSLSLTESERHAMVGAMVEVRGAGGQGVQEDLGAAVAAQPRDKEALHMRNGVKG